MENRAYQSVAAFGFIAWGLNIILLSAWLESGHVVFFQCIYEFDLQLEERDCTFIRHCMYVFTAAIFKRGSSCARPRYGDAVAEAGQGLSVRREG